MGNHVRDGLSHELIALIAFYAHSLQSQYPADLRAFDVNERFDHTVMDADPS